MQILWFHTQLQISIVLSINIAYRVHRQEVERVLVVAAGIGEQLKKVEHVHVCDLRGIHNVYRIAQIFRWIKISPNTPALYQQKNYT